MVYQICAHYFSNFLKKMYLLFNYTHTWYLYLYNIKRLRLRMHCTMQFVGSECRGRENVALVTDRSGKDTKRYVLLFGTAIFIICFAFAVSALIFYIVYLPLFLVKGGTVF